ncbi:MAG TPA: TRAP transporter substrate-binding protein DctP, partial [Polyangia bacterium]|nr:TRAP transporter substrate-binding protein DctP [Polyangia bacterium]
MSPVRAAVLLLLLGVTTAARANPPVVLRLASIAPEHTPWAQALRNFARDVESQSNGQVVIKWYLSGVAGDDVEAGERIKSGQLDGMASGGRFCARLSPTLRALRILATEREQSAYATNRMKADIDDEFQRAGFVNLGVTTIGPDVLFTKTPVHNLADMRHGHYWVWDLDRDLGAELREMGLHVVPMPIDRAAHGYDSEQIDGFIAAPTAALAFQWSTQAR